VKSEKALTVIEIIFYLFVNKPAHPVLIASAVRIIIHHLCGPDILLPILLPKDSATTFCRADIVRFLQLICFFNAE
jgi:hypothetical protein